jgi:hypothetical protein
MLADCQALECCLALYASVSLALHCVDTSRPASSDVHEAVRFACVCFFFAGARGWAVRGACKGARRGRVGGVVAARYRQDRQPLRRRSGSE